jgi:excisionase family DNA binding protein
MTKLLTIPDFAEVTGLSYWLARELVNRGDIPSVRVGTRRRIDARVVERWTHGEQPTVPPPAAALAERALLEAYPELAYGGGRHA